MKTVDSLSNNATILAFGISCLLVAAMISSVTGKPWGETLFIGEVGLLGEVKPGIAFDQRYKEAKKLKFKNILAFKGIPNIAQIV